jgi:hypothetical protein
MGRPMTVSGDENRMTRKQIRKGDTLQAQRMNTAMPLFVLNILPHSTGTGEDKSRMAFFNAINASRNLVLSENWMDHGFQEGVYRWSYTV